MLMLSLAKCEFMRKNGAWRLEAAERDEIALCSILISLKQEEDEGRSTGR